MHQRFRSLLSGISTSEQADLIVRAIALAEERGFADFQDSLEQDMLGLAEQPGEIVQYLITQRLTPFFSDMLQNMGVELIEEATLSQYLDITQWLCQVENFDDNATLNNLAVSDNDDAEILADILAVISAKHADEIFPLLETVSPYLITRIAELTNASSVRVGSSRAEPSYRRAVERLQALLPVLARDPAYSVHADIISQFGQFNKAPFSAFGELTDVYPQLSRAGRACATAVICVMSNLPDEELEACASDFIRNQEHDALQAVGTITIARRLIQEAIRG